MNNDKFTNPAVIIKIACMIIFLMADAGCIYQTQSITGKVVDESGATLGDVSVSACYSGWGWSAGQLVWDKDFCSEPVLTNKSGLYSINFNGPSSMRLRAKKEGWIQTQDFNTTDSHIILTSNKDYSARQTAKAKLSEKKFQRRLPDESDTAYYCRVVLSKNRPVKLNYQDETLSITPTLFKYDDHNDALFAIQGSFTAASAFKNEVMLKINGETINTNFSIRPVATNCKSDIYFIGANISEDHSYLHPGPADRIEILVPSVSAMFDMQIWRYLTDLKF